MRSSWTPTESISSATWKRNWITRSKRSSPGRPTRSSRKKWPRSSATGSFKTKRKRRKSWKGNKRSSRNCSKTGPSQPKGYISYKLSFIIFTRIGRPIMARTNLPEQEEDKQNDDFIDEEALDY